LTKHNAPSVVYPLGRSHFGDLFLLGCWLTGLSLVVLWFYTARLVDWRIGLEIFAICSVGVGIKKYGGNSPVGQLAWDGEAWRWESSGYQTGLAEQTISVVVDLQDVLLLRLENQARAKMWLWVEKKKMPERWLDLRRAVYSPNKSTDRAQLHDLAYAKQKEAVAISIGDELPTSSHANKK